MSRPEPSSSASQKWVGAVVPGRSPSRSGGSAEHPNTPVQRPQCTRVRLVPVIPHDVEEEGIGGDVVAVDLPVQGARLRVRDVELDGAEDAQQCNHPSVTRVYPRISAHGLIRRAETIRHPCSLDMDEAPRSVLPRCRVSTSASTSACTPRLTARWHNRTRSEIDRLDNGPDAVDGATFGEGLDEHSHEHQSGGRDHASARCVWWSLQFLRLFCGCSSWFLTCRLETVFTKTAPPNQCRSVLEGWWGQPPQLPLPLEDLHAHVLGEGIGLHISRGLEDEVKDPQLDQGLDAHDTIHQGLRAPLR